MYERYQMDRLSLYHSICLSARIPRELLAFPLPSAQRWFWSQVTLLWCFQHLKDWELNVLFPCANTASTVARTVTLLPTELPVSIPFIIGLHSWSHRDCVPLVSETKHCICCSILVILQWLMETSKTAIYRFTFCLSSSVQRVLTHCPSNLISHAAFKCRAGPWPLSGGDSCQIQIVGYRSWLLKPTHSFLLQIIAHSLKPCFTVRRLAGKRSTYCISKVSQGDKG